MVEDHAAARVDGDRVGDCVQVPVGSQDLVLGESRGAVQGEDAGGGGGGGQESAGGALRV